MPTASVANLEYRARLLRALRAFFDAKNFVEVQTPVLSAETIVDDFVEPFVLTDPQLPITPHGDRRYFLQTSPEFAMKRLLAAGMTAIYQIGPVFRKGDRGRFHNVEFTMLEWYRVGDDYKAGQRFLAELIEHVSGRTVRFCTFIDLFESKLGVNPHRATPRQLRTLAETNGVVWPESFLDPETDDEPGEAALGWLDLLFSELVQPDLDAVIVCDFPASQSQLARIRMENDDAVSERFELFLNGVELANGYHELLDASELRRRFQETARRRKTAGRPDLPVESRLLQAMEAGLPPCSGCALGLERLLMTLLNADSIDEVLPFPIDRA